MRITTASLILCLPFTLAAACSESGPVADKMVPPVDSPPVDSPPVDSPPVAFPPAAPPPLAPKAPWDSNSRHLDVSCFGFFIGSMGFAADRDQLSAEQLSLLEGLQVVDGIDECIADLLGCSVAITGADGSPIEYLAIEEDSTCHRSPPFISFNSLRAFLATVPCRYAKQGDFLGGENSSSLPVDERCLNGIFTPGSGTITRVLPVANAGESRHLHLLECGGPNQVGKLSFSVVDPDTGATIASGQNIASGPKAACVQADLTFPHAGSYPLRLVISGGFAPAGDFYARYF